MITINVVTKAVRLDPGTPIMARNQFGNATYGYVRGHIEPNYPVPAIRQCSSWGNDIAYITIWPNVLQIRISDEYLHGDYTGFGAVVTFNIDTGECQCRYDDFD